MSKKTGASTSRRTRGRRAAKRQPRRAATSKPTQVSFPVVGVGASAGGLAAISSFLEALPKEPGMAFVVVSHLAPQSESILAALLANRSLMPVHQARQGDILEPDHVYVGPPGKHMLLRNGTLHLEFEVKQEGPTAIDGFFASLAADRDAGARGVLLSGGGNDGTEGLKLIKLHGGVTFAQDPDTAQFKQMPASAIAAGCVDYVLPPPMIARQLLDLPRTTGSPVQPRHRRRSTADPYADIISALPHLTGVDFTQYKPATLRRRIAKRMLQSGYRDPVSYLERLRTDAAEARTLFLELLIRVSAFFRDPDAFKALERKVIAPLLREIDVRKPIRVWVPGCARGEELYSIGMLLLEHAAKRRKMPRIQLFGTDVSAPDVELARIGRFPEQIAADIAPARLKRFFEKESSGYRVVPELRERCVFACHELGSDPPFSKLDLISCRNVLIYFNSALQDRVIETFHFALKPGGSLFLGRSESPRNHPELFGAIDSSNRIYRRKGSVGTVPHRAVSATPRAAWPHAAPPAPTTAAAVSHTVDRVLLDRYAPPGLYIDDDLVIRAFRGEVGAYLQPATGQANLQLSRMLPAGVVLDIRAAMKKMHKSARPLERETTFVGPDGQTRNVKLVLMRVTEPDGRSGYLVMFEPAQHPSEERTPGPAPRARERSEVTRVTRQLAATREQLQTLMQDQEQSAEELRVSNEEALSANEELQSSNEELQTAKEELQSTNEELATLNDELQNRNRQLDGLAGELSTLIAGVNIPIVHLDPERRVRRFSPAAGAVFNLIAGDIGRRFDDIKPKIPLPDIDAQIGAALEHGTVSAREVQEQRSGRWYSLRVRPFREAGNRISGVLIALVDIDATKRNISAIVETMQEPLLVLNHELRVLNANRAFYRSFKTTEERTLNQRLFELGNRQWDVPALRRQLEEVLPKRRRFEDFRVEHEFPQIGRKVFRVSGQQIVDEGEGTQTILLILHDVTGPEALADRLRDAREENERRVARDLHKLSDTELVSVNRELEQLADRVAKDPAEVAHRLQALRQRIRRLSSSTQKLALRIRPVETARGKGTEVRAAIPIPRANASRK